MLIFYLKCSILNAKLFMKFQLNFGTNLNIGLHVGYMVYKLYNH